MADGDLLNVTVVGDIQDVFRGYREAAFPLVKQAFSQSVFAIHKQVMDNTRTALKRRTGTLAKSLKTAISGDTIDNLEAYVYSDVIYSDTQEYGATITAKNAYKGVPGGPYLNIPLPANKTPAGVQKLSAFQVFQRGGTIMKSRHNNYLIVEISKGRGANKGKTIVKPMFVLKKEVKIPPRLGIRQAIENEMPNMLDNIRNAISMAISAQ